MAGSRGWDLLLTWSQFLLQGLVHLSYLMMLSHSSLFLIVVTDWKHLTNIGGKYSRSRSATSDY